MNVGLDIGSTTIKCVVINEAKEIVYQSYERHKSRVREMALEKLQELKDLLAGETIHLSITGSAGMGISQTAGFPFVQEVFAGAFAIRDRLNNVDIEIELGGEDAKIVYFQGAIEERMNSSCAGGTGAFIDQMATLLNVDIDTFDEMSLKAERLYPIASRCGVFAKTDVQPLINQGAKKEDIAASIYQAVVDQTISGLAQGRPLKGKIVFLGGPLTFLKGLRRRFVETLDLDEEHALFPEGGQYYVALGAAIHAGMQKESYTYDEVIRRLQLAMQTKEDIATLKPLFKDQAEYDEFIKRHQADDVAYNDLLTYEGKAYIGIDAGSTTTKIVVLDEDCRILYQHYQSNHGNPVEVIKQQLTHIYELAPQLKIGGSAVTGYGEDLIRSGFRVDDGLVETQAHYEAARYFNADVDFILDIGGQDMKCFKIKDHAIEDIILNEACSSGCGSFLETFAISLGVSIEDFAKKALFAKHPVELGSRCTVFMNSSVKQAQKNGATVEDISAGLAFSVVKNALYKVIRLKNKDEIGKEIVVQGGTFLNDAVLRAFELELGHEVIRPSIAGLMGAFGAALYTMKRHHETSSLLSYEEVKNLTHQAKPVMCQGCNNHCHLTLNIFPNGRRQIAGNRCDKPVSGKAKTVELPNLYTYKYDLLMSYPDITDRKVTIGIPVALNMFENLPFWYAFFDSLGYGILKSGKTSKKMYIKGQQHIPSDTVCYPAKIVHGHIAELVDRKVDYIFYPCMTYNFDEKISDNHFNCPVVAYYPELIDANMDVDHFLYPYISLNDQASFEKHIYTYLRQAGFKVSRKGIHEATNKGYAEYARYQEQVNLYAYKAMQFARANHKKMVVLAGRPYHVDPFIHHGISDLLESLGLVVLSEDSLAHFVGYEKRDVINQWTYHARMYNAARVVGQNPDMELIQLVSFGCGIDAITSDEVRAILQSYGRLYTQIKIDEISNLGAVRIRIRSLLAAMKEREENDESSTVY